MQSKIKKEFYLKINIVEEEEADETLFWFEMILESELMIKENLNSLIKEADELTAIFTATAKTSKSKK